MITCFQYFEIWSSWKSSSKVFSYSW